MRFQSAVLSASGSCYYQHREPLRKVWTLPLFHVESELEHEGCLTRVLFSKTRFRSAVWTTVVSRLFASWHRRLVINHVTGRDTSVRCFDDVMGKVHLPCRGSSLCEMCPVLYLGIQSLI